MYIYQKFIGKRSGSTSVAVAALVFLKAGSHWTDFDRKKRKETDAIESQAWQNGALRKLTKGGRSLN